MNKVLFFFVALFCTHSFASANQDYQTIQRALITNVLVAELNSSKLSNATRENVLASSSEADLVTAKSILVRWKKPAGFNFHADFDNLVMTDRKGNEVLRVFPKLNTTGVFYINGREWTVPKEGSVFKSLGVVLSGASDDSKHASRTIFEIMQAAIARAHAQNEGIKSELQKVSFFYATMQIGPGYFLAQPPKIAIMENNPAYNMIYTKGGLTEKLWKSATGGPKDVQCTASGAKGRVLVGKEPLEFQTTADGRVIFRMFDDQRTSFQAKAGITPIYEQRAKLIRDNIRELTASSSTESQRKTASYRLNLEIKDLCRIAAYAQTESVTKFCANPDVIRYNNKKIQVAEAELLAGLAQSAGIPDKLSDEKNAFLVHNYMSFYECADSNCSSVIEESKVPSMAKWIGDGDSTAVGIALNHVPRDQRDLGYVIDFDCPKDTKCQNLVLKNPELLSSKSKKEAEIVLGTANAHYSKTESDHRALALSLAPLHGCCADEQCRNSDFGKSLSLSVDSEGTGAGQKTSK